MKKFLCIFLVLLLVGASLTVCFAAKQEVNGCNWMSVIADNTSLADISMPGTHDTAATYVAFGIKSRTQNKTVPEQLNCGVRFMDIRLALEGEKLKLVHNFISCRKGSGFSAPKLYFDDVIGYCLDFLDKNSEESLVMFIKKDSGTSNGFDECLQQYVEQNPARWYTQNRVPTLGEVRGKIVIINRFSAPGTILNNETGGINLMNFPSQKKTQGSFEVVSLDAFGGSMISTYTVQDRYQYPKEEKWEKAVVPTLELQKASGELLINFLSTAEGISPEINATYINAAFAQYALDQTKCYGAVLFDFVNEDLAKQVYACNQSVTDAARTPALFTPCDAPKPQHGLIHFLDMLWDYLIKKGV